MFARYGLVFWESLNAIGKSNFCEWSAPGSRHCGNAFWSFLILGSSDWRAQRSTKHCFDLRGRCGVWRCVVQWVVIVRHSESRSYCSGRNTLHRCAQFGSDMYAISFCTANRSVCISTKRDWSIAWRCKPYHSARDHNDCIDSKIEGVRNGRSRQVAFGDWLRCSELE